MCVPQIVAKPLRRRGTLLLTAGMGTIVIALCSFLASQCAIASPVHFVCCKVKLCLHCMQFSLVNCFEPVFTAVGLFHSDTDSDFDSELADLLCIFSCFYYR